MTKRPARGHHYFTLINDLDRPRVLFVAEDRTTASLNEFSTRRTDGQLDAVQAVTMDMWDPYVRSTVDHLPGAHDKIVYDKFHIPNIFSRVSIRCDEKNRNNSKPVATTP